MCNIIFIYIFKTAISAIDFIDFEFKYLLQLLWRLEAERIMSVEDLQERVTRCACLLPAQAGNIRGFLEVTEWQWAELV